MSGGEQQMLAMGRALMANPTLLLLDEPSLGLAPMLVDRIYETVAEINKQGTTILLVEQSANYALEVSNRGYVLETGKVVLTDNSSALRDQPRSPEGVPRNMTVFALLGAHGALAHLRLARVGDRRPPTCRTARATASARARVRPAAQRHRHRHLARRPGQGRVDVEAARPVRAAATKPPPARTQQRRGRRPLRAGAAPARRSSAGPAGLAAGLGHRDGGERRAALAGARRDLAPDESPVAYSITSQ